MLRRTYVLASIAFALSILTSTDAAATAQRTFVASSGNDANVCSLTLPCRGFAAAVAQTTAGGEVIVLDSGGYGPVTITQSVSLIAPAGVYGGITVPAGQTGVLVNGVGISVVLRGLTINSLGGTYGVRMTNGSVLTVEDCVISKFGAGATGVSIETPATVKIAGTVVRDTSNGISVGNAASANIMNSQINNSDQEGVIIHVGSSGVTNVYITDTVISGIGGFGACIDNSPQPGMTGHMAVTRVTLTICGVAILNHSVLATTTVSNSMVTGNGTGFYNASGTFQSLGNNNVGPNTLDTLGTITNILPM